MHRVMSIAALGRISGLVLPLDVLVGF